MALSRWENEGSWLLCFGKERRMSQCDGAECLAEAQATENNERRRYLRAFLL